MIDEQLVKNVVDYFNINHSTVRETAKEFGISKSSVYIYILQRFVQTQLLPKFLLKIKLNGIFSVEKQLKTSI